ncbi:MAG: hydrogenase maturation protease [Lentisphaerae bacterium]|jgi:hydrogenase maturation protease|nr:hydrogenase maturation protease [Lentisphaerota bacterium]MBT4821220.1 hydrogenase maturation protease [Lentisphaerota bacterium]MBT5609656.1 hydrogenase maturation protease [Lentisphaerota bacterium]MBT7055256.1 hydrogenase maturation protease [Lentisphaerota bacterium]MBT7841396.1 hydrogenase maturation protease [Lentisphaerota bacterium]
MGTVLVLGYGNPGRLDDGLGPALAERVAALAVPGVEADANYQLSVEDAALVAEHDAVVFADASVSGAEPFSYTELEAEDGTSFTSHHVDPRQVLYLAQTLFKSRVRGFLLGIRGYEFNEFDERLSAQARQNLDAAAAFLEQHLPTVPPVDGVGTTG